MSVSRWNITFQSVVATAWPWLYQATYAHLLAGHDGADEPGGSVLRAGRDRLVESAPRSGIGRVIWS
jgi:hypothetical protein